MQCWNLSVSIPDSTGKFQCRTYLPKPKIKYNCALLFLGQMYPLIIYASKTVFSPTTIVKAQIFLINKLQRFSELYQVDGANSIVCTRNRYNYYSLMHTVLSDFDFHCLPFILVMCLLKSQIQDRWYQQKVSQNFKKIHKIHFAP